MIARMLCATGVVFLLASTEVALAAAKPTCDDIQEAADEAEPTLSPEELARKLGVSVQRVNDCMRKEAAEQRPVDNPPTPKP